MTASTNSLRTSTHWGDFIADVVDGDLREVRPADRDTNPSPIGQSLMDSQDRGCRIDQPCVRQGYLENPGSTDGTGRGVDPFVAVSWDEALDLAAGALRSTVANHGNQAIFGGSYGWASAGRFHHAQSQVHRFLNKLGGYTRSIGSYSTGTAQVIVPHVLGVPSLFLQTESPTAEDVATHTKLVVSFGGISMKNMQINQGGITDHTARDQLQGWKAAGVDVVCVSPTRDDVADFLDADWWPVRPNSDVALMLGLAHTLHAENLHDTSFLASHCVGYDQFGAYLIGAVDGIAKDADWAAALCDVGADQIRALARRMAKEPCLLSISWSLQRTEHGEQPYWMLTVLGAMLGTIGLPGQGVGFGYGCIHNYGFAGRHRLPFSIAALPQGTNAVADYIPVARIADLLSKPGEVFPFNGQQLTYPDIKLVYWAGGNPFHHHQDLNRLRQAWSRPETVIVNEPFWTATARHADIVFPTTTSLEREDFAWGGAELSGSPMHQVLGPFEQSKNDYDVFAGLAQRLGIEDEFTEGRTAREWLEHLWEKTVARAAAVAVALPSFDEFWQDGARVDPASLPATTFVLEAFRADPDGAPLPTPSGKIEIFSQTLASFNLDDCGGHPAWRDKQEFIGSQRSKKYPLALNSNQPITRLHSQYDFGRTSKNAKISGREKMTIHPRDAAARGIGEGDIVRLFNDRGACLAGASISDRVRPGVVVLPTGAWYDPLDPSDPKTLDVHGNPNVLTRDVGTSTLAQQCSAHSCLVDVELFEEPLPPIRAFEPPPITVR